MEKENTQDSKIVVAKTVLVSETNTSLAKYDAFTYKTYSSDKDAMIYKSAGGQNWFMAEC